MFNANGRPWARPVKGSGFGQLSSSHNHAKHTKDESIWEHGMRDCQQTPRSLLQCLFFLAKKRKLLSGSCRGFEATGRRGFFGSGIV